MIPDFVSEDCKSNAERRLFERFRKEVPATVTVLHSLGVAKHRWKLYSEADFVLVHEKGLLVFEVKGGRVSRKDGAWYFEDRYGRVNKRKESPMHQAETVTAAIRKSVKDRFGDTSPQARVAFGALTFFPDIPFKDQSVEWDLERVLDIDSWQRPLRALCAESIMKSRSRTKGVTGHEPATLTPAELAELLDYLRGDFEKLPSLAVTIDGHEQQMVRLAPQQFDIIDQTSKNDCIAVEGPAGTGKTLIAMECARRHAEAGRTVLFVCFNKLLALHLDAYAKRNGLSGNLSIDTLHGHCLSVLRAAEVPIDPDTEEKELYKEEIPRLVVDAMGRLQGLKLWDVLVVDEGQDIAGHAPFVQVLGKLLSGGFEKGRWIWFEDPNQRIIRHGQTGSFNLKALGPFYVVLKRNWRNTNEVATFVSVATRFPLPTLSGISGPKVRKVTCAGADIMKTLTVLVAELFKGGCKAEHVVLLTARAESDASFAGATAVAGYNLVPYDPRVPPSPGQLRWSSVFRFKGLEASVIVLIDVSDLDAELHRMAGYVGMSRATSSLCVVFNEAADKHYEANRLAHSDATA
jgi:hypothetical protein